VDVVISFPDKSSVVPGDFENFKGGYQGNGHQYMTGSITLEKLLALSKRNDVSVIVAPLLNIHSPKGREVYQETSAEAD
jgi:uncharacterized cupin superfamily protein